MTSGTADPLREYAPRGIGELSVAAGTTAACVPLFRRDDRIAVSDEVIARRFSFVTRCAS
jgi:hypothetical protein